MKLLTTKIGDWLADWMVPRVDKIEHCFNILTSARNGSDCYTLEAIGKAACHLAYRCIDGELSAEEEGAAFDYIQWSKDHAANCGRETAMHQARWTGSITMALVYMTILRRGNMKAAHNLCYKLAEDADTSIKALPSNAVNILRACLLQAAYCHAQQMNGAMAVTLANCHRYFRLAMSEWAFSSSAINHGTELVQCATAVKISLRIDEALRPVNPVAWEVSEPFKSAFIAMSPKDQTK